MGLPAEYFVTATCQIVQSIFTIVSQTSKSATQLDIVVTVLAVLQMVHLILAAWIMLSHEIVHRHFFWLLAVPAFLMSLLNSILMPRSEKTDQMRFALLILNIIEMVTTLVIIAMLLIGSRPPPPPI